MKEPIVSLWLIRMLGLWCFCFGNCSSRAHLLLPHRTINSMVRQSFLSSSLFAMDWNPGTKAIKYELRWSDVFKFHTCSFKPIKVSVCSVDENVVLFSSIFPFDQLSPLRSIFNVFWFAQRRTYSWRQWLSLPFLFSACWKFCHITITDYIYGWLPMTGMDSDILLQQSNSQWPIYKSVYEFPSICLFIIEFINVFCLILTSVKYSDTLFS